MEKFPINTSELLIQEYLPHNFLSERIILGNLLISPEVIEFTTKSLNVDAFYFKSHQEIYKAILTLYKDKKVINLTTLITFLQDKGTLNEIGGINTLLELTNQVPNIIDIDNYISLVQDKYLRRMLIKLSYRIINSSYITNISLEKIINDLEIEVFSLTKQNSGTDLLDSSELFSSVFEELKNKANLKTLPGITTGFHDLNALTQGFQKSDLIIIAGRPSMGKTAFCLNVAINILKETQLPVLFFSLEMSKEQLIHRILATETNISNMRLRSGNIKQWEWNLLNATIKKFSKLPLFIDDTSNLNLIELKTKIKKVLLNYKKLGVIIIDYLQLMENNQLNKNFNRVQELSQITRSLKIIAREFNIPVIVLSQLSRNVEIRLNKRPLLSDLRESGSIEQDADLVLMLYRDSYYNSETEDSDIIELIISKHRNGPIGLSKLKFNSEYMKFDNL